MMDIRDLRIGDLVRIGECGTHKGEYAKIVALASSCNYDLIKEESRKHKTESLMADGGSLAFEKTLEEIVRIEFEKRGLELITFTSMLDFTDEVKDKINSRNEVDTNLSVIDKQIIEQQKLNELERLKTEQKLIRSKGITPEILAEEFIQKWDGKTPLYKTVPEIIKMQ